MFRLRPARPEDGQALRQIERLAGERFRTVGLGWIADHEPPPIDELAGYADDGRSWVAIDRDDRPVGYVLVDVVDDDAHVEQVTVHPDHQGEGVGRALIDHVEDWARQRGSSAVTLTTFTEVSWNRPLYEHLGFRVLAEHEIGPGLRGVRAEEAAHGLEPATRVCMRREVSEGTPAVRRAGQREATALADLWLRARAASAPRIPSPVHSDDEVRAWFIDVVLPTREVWVAETSSGVVSGLLVLDGDWIDQLYVDPDQTGRGIGARLVHQAKAERPAGLQLWTFAANTGARRFYERHGFASVEQTDGDNEEGAPDVRYVWGKR